MKKEKETLQHKLARRKYKLPNKFMWWFLNKFVINPFLAPKYNPHYEVIDDINKCKTGCFLVYNHQSRFDYTYTCQMTYPRRINFVVGYNEFFRSKFVLISKLMHFIPKKNFNSDIPAFMAMREIIKQNGVVCIAPEGMSSITGHNQPVGVGTGKLFKHFKVPVYCQKQCGGFLTTHKCCLDARPGRVDAKLYLLFTPEDLEKMSPEEIENKLNEALWEDDYEWNKTAKVKYKTNNRICTHMHDLLYRCPRCGTELEMIGEKNYVKCNHCGNGATMDDYYVFHPFDEKCIIPESPSKWVDEERKIVYHQIQDPNYEFKEHVKIGTLPKYKYVGNNKTSELCGEGEITINHEGLFYKGTKYGKPFEFKLDYHQLPTLGMVTDCTYFALYVDDEYYDVFPSRPVVGKVLLTVEEMHRLHVNQWKNFPWMDTYKD